jgi:hypothetical protein
VDEPVPVRLGQRLGDLAKKVARLVRNQRPPLPNQRLEVVPGNEFHDVIVAGLPVRFGRGVPAGIQARNDVRVLKPGHRPGLGIKPVQHPRPGVNRL